MYARRIGQVVEALIGFVEESPEDDRLELTATPISIEREGEWRRAKVKTTITLLACQEDGIDVEVAAVLWEHGGQWRVTGFIRRYDAETSEWPNFQGFDEIERRFNALVKS